MTQRRRDTRYAREIATAKLPSGPGGKTFAAIERIHVKQADQVEIRFSWWEGSRMMPRPLDLPEEELLPLLQAALDAGVFSETFVRNLRQLLAEPAAASGGAAPATADLEKVQAHFHQLIRSRAGDRLGDRAAGLPRLSRGVPREADPAWFAVEGMNGGFRYWWDASAPGLRLIVESSFRNVAGSGQLHEITPTGAHLLGEGFD
jgi:hypothetical protein